MALFGPPDVEKLKVRHDVRGLVRALGYQQDRFVRMTAAEALGELGEPTAIKTLAAVLEDSSQDVQRAAFHALGRIGSDVAIQPLLASSTTMTRPDGFLPPLPWGKLAQQTQ